MHSAVLPLMNRREIFLAGPLQTLRNDPVEELHHGMLQPNVWVLLRSSHTRDRFREDRQLLLLRKRF
jgi:hypothetical protein